LPRHLYAFLAPQSAQIVHATMGEKKENFLRKSAAAVEGVWLNSKKKWQEKMDRYRAVMDAVPWAAY